MYCVCGREITSTSTTPWASCTIVDGKVISGICVHGKNFPSVKECVDRLKEITPKEYQI